MLEGILDPIRPEPEDNPREAEHLAPEQQEAVEARRGCRQPSHIDCSCKIRCQEGSRRVEEGASPKNDGSGNWMTTTLT